MNKVLIIGSCNTDMVVTPPRFPQPGETLLGGEFYTFPGGKGANQAVAARRAGAQVTFVGAVGQDMFGDNALRALADEGVDVSHCLQMAGVSSGVGVIMLSQETRNNMIVVAPGANLALLPEHLQQVQFADYDVALFQLENLVETVHSGLLLARQAGCTTILNPAPAQLLSDETLQCVDILIPNEHELKLVSGLPDTVTLDEAAQIVLSKGVPHIIVTCGEAGCFHFIADAVQSYPTHKVEPIDTVGAGDCFNGCFGAALACGSNIAQAIRFALCAATISVTTKGAQPSMPTRQQVEQHLSN